MSAQSRRQSTPATTPETSTADTGQDSLQELGPVPEAEPEHMPMLSALAGFQPLWGPTTTEWWEGEARQQAMLDFRGNAYMDDDGNIPTHKVGGSDTHRTESAGWFDSTKTSTDTRYHSPVTRSASGETHAVDRARGKRSHSTSEGTELDVLSRDKMLEPIAAKLRGKMLYGAADKEQAEKDLARLETASIAEIHEIGREHGVEMPMPMTTTSRTTVTKHEDTDVNAWNEASYKRLTPGTTNQTTTTVDHDGTETTETSSDTTTTKLKDGIHRERVTSSGKSVTSTEVGGGEYGGDTKKTSSESTTTSERRGLLMSEESGIGGTLGKTKTTVADGVTTKTGGDASLSTKGASAEGTYSQEVTHGGIKLGRSLTPSGKLRLDVKYDAEKDRYVVKTTLNVGLKGGVSGGESSTPDPDASGASASFGLTGGVDAAYSATRVLTPDEAKAYLGNVEKVDKGEGVPKRPEFDIFSRWCAGLPLVDTGVDMEDARKLKAGEEISIKTTKSLGGSLGAQAKADAAHGGAEDITVWGSDTATKGSSVGGSVSGEKTWIRTLTAKAKTLTVPGPDGVDQSVDVTSVTISLSDSEKTSLTGSLQDGVASGSITKTMSEGKGRSVTFDLRRDGSFAERFERISDVHTLEELEALAKDPTMGGAASFSGTKSRGDGMSGSASIPGAKFAVGHEQSFEDTTTLEGGKLAGGSAKGTLKQNASLDMGGVLGIGSDSTQEAEGTVSKTGLSLSVKSTTKDTSTHPGNAPDVVSKGIDAFGKKSGEDQLGTLGSLANGGVKGLLKKAMTETKTTLVEVKLTEAQSELLAGRAHMEGTWSDCADWHKPKVIAAWEELGERLRTRSVPKSVYNDIIAEKKAAGLPAEVAAGEEWTVMVNLARARAFAAFIAEGDRVPLDNAVFRFGEEFGDNTESIASITEWPEDIADQKPILAYHLKQLKVLEGQSHEARDAAAMAKVDAGLDTVRAKVEGATFSEIRAQSALLQSIDDARTRIDVLQTPGADQEGPLPEGQQRFDVAWKIARTEKRLREYAAKESALFEQIATEELSWKLFSSAEESAELERRLMDLHDLWEDEVKQAEPLAAYAGKTLGGPRPRVAIRKKLAAGDKKTLQAWAKD